MRSGYGAAWRDPWDDAAAPGNAEPHRACARFPVSRAFSTRKICLDHLLHLVMHEVESQLASLHSVHQASLDLFGRKVSKSCLPDRPQSVNKGGHTIHGEFSQVAVPLVHDRVHGLTFGFADLESQGCDNLEVKHNPAGVLKTRSLACESDGHALRHGIVRQEE